MRKEEKALPSAQQQRYEAFKQTLQQVQQRAVSPNANSLMLRSEVTALQQYFHEQLLSLSTDTFSTTTQQWVQSYQVEMDKQLRLLGMDVLFLQAAKQAATALQRQQQVCDRLGTLQRYCEALLGGEEKDEE
ncbi:heterocyst frequency control protein PatD [Phormidium sp. FACHB-592]|uniref:Heterocyst frequency control protein PatD n=1 Tax=Stenomitos frigidus AS-A4 TaxID=2933935 RepID=A0ABV0KIR6_9CYAN|nr:heterocyst frequency control protein PatD [Phormidium sp. FACHB-592]